MGLQDFLESMLSKPVIALAQVRCYLRDLPAHQARSFATAMDPACATRRLFVYYLWLLRGTQETQALLNHSDFPGALLSELILFAQAQAAVSSNSDQASSSGPLVALSDQKSMEVISMPNCLRRISLWSYR